MTQTTKYQPGQEIQVQLYRHIFENGRFAGGESYWVSATFERYVPGLECEDFCRMNVVTKDGRRFEACHPNCVR